MEKGDEGNDPARTMEECNKQEEGRGDSANSEACATKKKENKIVTSLGNGDASGVVIKSADTPAVVVTSSDPSETESTATNEFAGLEDIPPCSLSNLSVVMTRRIENVFYR